MSLDLNDLCHQGGVTARTVRYYVQQGLLPSPGLGAGARYTDGHLARLRLIRLLQVEHLPLAEIRRRLESLDDEAVQALLEVPTPPGALGMSSAADYVRGVFGEPPGSAPRPAPRPGRRWVWRTWRSAGRFPIVAATQLGASVHAPSPSLDSPSDHRD